MQWSVFYSNQPESSILRNLYVHYQVNKSSPIKGSYHPPTRHGWPIPWLPLLDCQLQTHILDHIHYFHHSSLSVPPTAISWSPTASATPSSYSFASHFCWPTVSHHHPHHDYLAVASACHCCHHEHQQPHLPLNSYCFCSVERNGCEGSPQLRSSHLTAGRSGGWPLIFSET